MSSDRNATNNQDQPHGQPQAQNVSPSSTDKQQREAPPSSVSSAVDEKANAGDAPKAIWMSSETESDFDEDEPKGPLVSTREKLRRFVRQLSPILVPLPFAAIIFLLSLLANAHGITYSSPLPLGIILLALAVIQGICLFYAGGNETFWILSIIGGYALFLLVGAYVFFGFAGSLLLLAILLVLGIVFARLSIHTVPAGSVDIVTIFGKYRRTLSPGLHLVFPWEKIKTRLNVRESQWNSHPQRVQVTQDKDVVLRAALSYKVVPEDAYIVALRVDDWQKSLDDFFNFILREIIYELSPDDLIAFSQGLHEPPSNQGAMVRIRWERINRIILERMQDRVASWGVLVNWARILDSSLIPHSSELFESTQGGKPQKPQEKTQAKSVFAQLRDAPTTTDLLKFRQYTNAIARNLANFSEGSDKDVQLSIGVYGEWGSGKSSFLQMVWEALKRDYDIHPILFDAWKYDQDDNLWAALIQTILNQAPLYGNWYQRISVRFRIWKNSISLHQGLWEIVRKIFPLIFKILFIAIILYVLIGLDNKTIAAFLSQWLPNNSVITASVQASALKVIAALSAAVAATSGPFSLISLFQGNLGIDFSKFKEKRSYQEHIAFLDKFNQEFENIISLLGQGKPLVVIIDDLDRCPPDKITQVIEATKIFLNAKGCVFLFGLDRDVVERAVASKYKDIIGMDSGNSNELPHKEPVFYHEYIDKFIQLPIVLPGLTESNMNRFISLLSDDPDIKTCADIFAVGLSPNPRKIKRVLQTFLFIRDMVTDLPHESPVVTPILAKLVVIQNEKPNLFEDIIKDRDILRELELYYRWREDKQRRNGPAAPAEEKDQPSHKQDHELVKYNDELAHKYDEYEKIYPQLPNLLLTRVNDSDSFLEVDMSQYMDMLGFLVVVKPAVPQN